MKLIFVRNIDLFLPLKPEITTLLTSDLSHLSMVCVYLDFWT